MGPAAAASRLTLVVQTLPAVMQCMCSRTGNPSSPPACFAIVQVSWEFEVPYIKESQKEGLT